MKKNSKGQALVEFVIILPIFIFMIFSCLDLGRILYYKNSLESKMDEAITLYKSGSSDTVIKNTIGNDVNIEIEKSDQYINFSLNMEVDLITPGLNLILQNPYSITSKRVIYNE